MKVTSILVYYVVFQSGREKNIVVIRTIIVNKIYSRYKQMTLKSSF